jgi:hypothetical protein
METMNLVDVNNHSFMADANSQGVTAPPDDITNRDNIDMNEETKDNDTTNKKKKYPKRNGRYNVHEEL